MLPTLQEMMENAARWRKFSQELEILKMLKVALNSLDEAQIVLAEDPESTLLRDAAVKRFEFTYDLAARWLAHRLQATYSNAWRFGCPKIIQLSATKGLLDDQDAWNRYTTLRRYKAHEYAENEGKYADVVDDIPNFVSDVRKLLPPKPSREGLNNQHQVSGHYRNDAWVEGYQKSDGNWVSGHQRSGTRVRSHRRTNPR